MTYEDYEKYINKSLSKIIAIDTSAGIFEKDSTITLRTIELKALLLNSYKIGYEHKKIISK